jgi:hypothetical protein
MVRKPVRSWVACNEQACPPQMDPAYLLSSKDVDFKYNLLPLAHIINVDKTVGGTNGIGQCLSATW